MGIFGELKEEDEVQMLYKILNDVVSPDPTPMESPHYDLRGYHTHNIIVGMIHLNTSFSLKQLNHGTTYPLKPLHHLH